MSNDHSHAARSRIIAHKTHADLPGNWRAQKQRYNSFSLQVELPCINGLGAWFTVATFHEAGDDERLITDGARQEAGEYAAKFAALATWMGGQVASEKDTLISDMLSALEAIKSALPSHYTAAQIATEAIARAKEDAQ
jgi:hypothetical protein